MSASRFTRRTALIAGSALLAAAAAGATWLGLRPSLEELLVRMVQKHVGGGARPLDDEGLRRFAADYRRDVLKGSEQNQSWQALRLLGPSYELIAIPDLEGAIGTLYELERHVVSSYLIGSTYFTDSDLNAPVRYLALVNKKSACRNPFARFD